MAATPNLEISGSASVYNVPSAGSPNRRGSGGSLATAGRRSMFEAAPDSRRGGSGDSLFDEDGAPAAGGRTMVRARDWTPQVEDFYRLQFCGWRDENEYRSVYGEPDRWTAEQGGFISKLQLKSNGYYTYWRKWRECEDKHVNRVKIYA